MKPGLAYPILFLGTMTMALLTVYAAYSIKPDLFTSRQTEGATTTPLAPQDSMEYRSPLSTQPSASADTLLVLHRIVQNLQDSVRSLTTLLQKERAAARSSNLPDESTSPASHSSSQSRTGSGVVFPASIDSVVRTDPVTVAKVIETMNVEQAVKVLEHLNDEEAKSILNNMNKRQRGKILSATDPQRVARLIR